MKFQKSSKGILVTHSVAHRIHFEEKIDNLVKETSEVVTITLTNLNEFDREVRKSQSFTSIKKERY